MPKLGVEPIRRDALVQATIAEVGRRGSLDVTVAQIARAAGMSAALAHHYLGGKEQMFLAAMRHILSVYGAEVRSALGAAGADPAARLSAVIRASFTEASFRREAVAAWLNFYVLALTLPEARRLLAVYQRRLRSNLLHCLRPQVGARAGEVAERLAALIDGVYLREALSGRAPDRAAAVAMVEGAARAEVGR
jgi:TetR/AcrR family transcriptional repressor of bet genes